MAAKANANATEEAVAASNGKEVAVSTGFTTEEMRQIASFQDVQDLFAAHGITVVDAAEEIGDGFALVENDQKSRFEKREMMILGWSFSEGDFKREDGTKSEFVAIRFVSPEPTGGFGKYVITDGGSGIYQQLREYTDRTGVVAGLYVKKGLRSSRYANEYSDDAVTFYLDLSK